MRLATIAAWKLSDWAQRAKQEYPSLVEIHIVGQGYELRCGEIDRLFIEPDRSGSAPPIENGPAE